MNPVDNLIFDLTQEIEISATREVAYQSLIRRMTSHSSTPDNQPMPMVLEEWPGGRWYRDLGEGVGHLWGFVQVIKPPILIEIHGPMFMSYAATGHIQMKLTETAEGCELSLRHRVIGMLAEEHRQGLVPGWNSLISDVKADAETS